MSEKAFDNEDVSTLSSNVERSATMFTLDIHFDIVSLQQLRHHHPQTLVSSHTERSLAILIELVGIISNCCQLVDHVSVPEKKIFHLKFFPLSDSPLGVILLFEDSLYGRMKHDTNVLRFVGLFCGVTSSSSSEATITKAAHSAHTVAGV